MKQRFKVTTRVNPAAKAAPNLLQQDFTAPHPNQRWVADSTYGAPSLWSHRKWSPKQEQRWNASTSCKEAKEEDDYYWLLNNKAEAAVIGGLFAE